MRMPLTWQAARGGRRRLAKLAHQSRTVQAKKGEHSVKEFRDSECSVEIKLQASGRQTENGSRADQSFDR